MPDLMLGNFSSPPWPQLKACPYSLLGQEHADILHSVSAFFDQDKVCKSISNEDTSHLLCSVGDKEEKKT